MRIYTGENVSKSYGDKILFNDIEFSIGEKERIGLIGINGTGKSTLLKIIAQIEDYDHGEFSYPKDYKIAFLDQDPILNHDLTIIEQVLAADDEINRTIVQYEKTVNELAVNPNHLQFQEKLFHLQTRMDELSAWERNAKAKTVLTKLGLTNVNQKVGFLSGGQKKRVALAQVLIRDADLLILDEPTNHLDFEFIQWLQEELIKFSGSILFVTHDRYFLNYVSNKIYELSDGQLYQYPGNYSAYLESKAIREEEETKHKEKQRNLYKKELEWIRRGAKARTTKQKARIQRFEQLENDVQSHQQKDSLEISMTSQRLGKQVMEINNGYKRFDSKKILENFHLLLQPKDRLGIVGKNGSGKSTLLNILAGKERLDDGEYIVGQTVKIAYFTQETVDLDLQKRMIEYIKETGEVVETVDGTKISAAQMLERFLFPPYTHGTPIYKLSGGERKRLYLLKLLMGQPNVLLLDEPTNDLDTETLTVLEDYLELFPGVVITVSHDRYFLDKVCDQLLIFEGEGRITRYFGSYTEFLEKQKVDQERSIVNNNVKPSEKQEEPKKQKKKKLTFKEQKEWEEIDEKISTLEQEIEVLQKEMVKASSDYEKLNDLMKQSEMKNQELEYLIERWTYLAEIAEQ